MLVANQIDLKIPKQKLTRIKQQKFVRTATQYDYPVIEKELIPTNGTLLAIKQMKDGNLRSFDSVKEMMNEIG